MRWRKIILGVLLAFAGTFAVGYAYLMTTARPAGDHLYFTAGPARRPLVMAHQGGDGLWPGNTLYAFERAAALGVDVLEFDIHSTADGELIVMHDATVDRTTNGTGRIAAMTLKQIKTLDAGHCWSPDGGRTHPYRGQGITVPTLAEVLARFPDFRLNIEMKQVAPEAVANFCLMIRDRGLTNKVLVASVQGGPMETFRRECPEVATSATSAEVLKFLSLEKTYLGDGYTPAAQALQVPERAGALPIVTRSFVATARARNMQVHVWTINREDDMRRLIDLGVDGIFTDYPDRLLAVVGQKK